MNPRKIFLSLIIFAWFFVGCNTTQESAQTTILVPSLETGFVPANQSTVTPGAIGKTGRISVLAAASLTEAFTEIGYLYEQQNPGITVEFSFGGSQQLAQQIQQSAPADVFASASQKYMDALVDSGLVTAGTPKSFVENKLVVVVPSNNPGGLNNLLDLAKPKIKLVLAAREVPVGQYSLEFLGKATLDSAFGSGYKMNVLTNVVSYEDNVKSVLAKVVLGEADAGIVYLSDIAGDVKDQVIMIEIPDELNMVAKYPVAAISISKNPELAASFIKFVQSPEGQALMAKYGFLPAAGK